MGNRRIIRRKNTWNPQQQKEELVVIAITPAMALQALNLCNTKNRSVSGHMVNNLVDHMRKGRFNFNGIPIIFGKDGTVIDGQHRLWAIYKSGVTVKMAVLFGADESVRWSVDRQRSRSVSDDLKMEGINYGKFRKSVVSMVAELLLDKPPIIKDMPAYNDWLRICEDGLEWAIKELAPISFTRQAPIAGSLVFAYRTDPEGVRECGRRLRENSFQGRSDPLNVFYRYISGHSRGIDKSREDPTETNGKKRQTIMYGGVARKSVCRRILYATMMALQGNTMTSCIDNPKGIAHFRETYLRSRIAKELMASWQGYDYRLPAAPVVEVGGP